jgi:hypothetical protein
VDRACARRCRCRPEGRRHPSPGRPSRPGARRPERAAGTPARPRVLESRPVGGTRPLSWLRDALGRALGQRVNTSRFWLSGCEDAL